MRGYFLFTTALKKNLNASRPSEHVPVRGGKMSKRLGANTSHIQRSGCQPEMTTLYGGQFRSWSAEQGKENKKRKSDSTPLVQIVRTRRLPSQAIDLAVRVGGKESEL